LRLLLGPASGRRPTAARMAVQEAEVVLPGAVLAPGLCADGAPRDLEERVAGDDGVRAAAFDMILPAEGPHPADGTIVAVVAVAQEPFVEVAHVRRRRRARRTPTRMRTTRTTPRRTLTGRRRRRRSPATLLDTRQNRQRRRSPRHHFFVARGGTRIVARRPPCFFGSFSPHDFHSASFNFLASFGRPSSNFRRPSSNFFGRPSSNFLRRPPPPP